MLTADLVRARVVKGALKLRYVEAKDAEVVDLAGQIIAAYEAHVGKRRVELEAALQELQGEGTDFLLQRGLSKLVLDRCVFSLDAPVAPDVLREALFETAAKHFPPVLIADEVHTVTRDDVIAEVAAKFSIDPAVIARAMYADLDDEMVLAEVAPITAEALVHRYNTALAQAALYRATSLTIHLAPSDPARIRQMFRWIKFYRLMHSVSGDAATGYVVHLDGPLSLFQLSEKYGFQLAEFLPALLLGTGWRAESELLWGKEKRPVSFTLTSDEGLRSHYPDKGAYVTREEQWLEERMKDVGGKWKLHRRGAMFDLGGRGVLVPEYVAVHDDGRVAWIDLVGFWSRARLEARIALLKEHAPSNLVTVVPWRLRGSEDDLAEVPGEVMFYRENILAKDLLARLERVGKVVALPEESAATEAPAKKKRARAKKKAD